MSKKIKRLPMVSGKNAAEFDAKLKDLTSRFGPEATINEIDELLTEAKKEG